MRRAILVHLAAAAIAACAPGDAPATAERTDSAGVELVTNSGQDRALRWSAEPLWRIGGASDPDLVLQQLEPWEVVVSAERATIYVLDVGSNRILLLNDSGRVTETWGRSGNGPGELAGPSAIAAGDDAIAVFDYTRGGFARWSPNGVPLEVMSLAASFWGPQLAAHGAGYVFTALPDPRAGSELQRLVLQDSTGTHTITELRRMPDVIADLPSCGFKDMPMSPLFAPELVWNADRDMIAATMTPAYSIGIYRDGALVRMVRRAIAPQSVTEAMALQEAGPGLHISVTNCTVPPLEVVRARGFAPVVPGVRAIAIAPSGELWVLRGGVAGTPSKIDVFDDTGEYLGTLPNDFPFPAGFLADQRVVAGTTDSLDVPVLQAFRLRR